jgi:hypothetical protein
MQDEARNQERPELDRMPSIWGGLALTVLSAVTLIALGASDAVSEGTLSGSVGGLILILVYLPWL